LEELDELEEEDSMADERTLEEYRARRLEEMKAQRMRNRFGEVLDIVKDEWIREVTEGSKSCWVVVHLYLDAAVECGMMDEAMRLLAPKFRDVKFLRIKANQAIENWPDKNCPTLFCYHDGEMKKQVVTLATLGGKDFTPADLEWFLARNDIVQSEMEEDPRSSGSPLRKTVSVFGAGGGKIKRGGGGRNGLDSDDELDEDN